MKQMVLKKENEMKNRWLFGRILTLALLFSLSLPGSLQPMRAASLQAAKSDEKPHLAKLIGAWNVDASVPAYPHVPALLVFTSDGIVMGARPPLPFETPAYGNWIATDDETAAFTFMTLTGSEQGPFSAKSKISGTVHYDAATDSWQGPNYLEVYDPSGSIVFSDTGTLSGTRIAVEPLTASPEEEEETVDDKGDQLDQAKLQQAHDQVLAATGEYSATEQIVNFLNQGQKIVGTLTLPSGGNQPYPVVLFLHGFAADRNWLPITGTQEGIFGRAARILAEHGVASLRIDFRGSGESDGAFADMTYTGEIADTIVAMDYLATRPEVDSQRLALVGLSGGGLVAAETAARDPRVQSLILWSPVANAVDNLKAAVGAENVAAGLQSTDKPVHIVLPFGEIDLNKSFFEDLYKLDPIAAIGRVKRPMLVVVGLRDQAIIPQPQYGQLYLNYHNGPEKLVTVDGDHVFDALTDKGPLVLDDVIAWSLAWVQQTLPAQMAK